MKRNLCMFFIVIATLSVLPSAQLTHLHMGIGNDLFTLGLGDNLDDGLSFGGHMMFAYDDWLFLKIDALGFTDRLSTPAHRYDQVNINLYTPQFFSWNRLHTTVTPLVGLALTGKLDFDQVQNGLHQQINQATVEIPYDLPTVQSHLNLGTTVQVMLPIRWTQIGIEGSYLHTFAWEGSTQITAVLKLGSSLMLKAGYSILTDYGSGSAHSAMMDRLSGPTFSYYFDGGLLTNSWVYHRESGSSYGVIGIDIMQLFQPVTYDHTDFTYSLGFHYDMTGNQNRSFTLIFSPIIMQAKNKSGPMMEDSLLGLEERLTVASWMVGYIKEWEWTTIVHPYLAVMGGFQRMNLQTSPTDIRIEAVRPTISLETGFKFGRDGQWVAKNNSYRPRLATAIQYVFAAQDIKAVDADFAPHVGPWLFSLGIGIDIGHDPH